jgi:hypothetical protein
VKGVLFDSIEGFFIRVFANAKGGNTCFDARRKSST